MEMLLRMRVCVMGALRSCVCRREPERLVYRRAHVLGTLHKCVWWWAGDGKRRCWSGHVQEVVQGAGVQGRACAHSMSVR